jgi:hypothetical protein
MSVSGILSSAFSQQQLSAVNPYQQKIQQLGQDLQSGNLKSAQSDFATLQQAFSQSAATSGTTSADSSTNTTIPVTQTFSQLASDLQSGNLPAAQTNASTLQQTLQSPNGTSSTHHLHHHHSGGGGGDSTNQNPLLEDLNQVGQSLTSGNLSSAQQAYATLQQQLQQFALGGGAIASESPFSLEA